MLHALMLKEPSSRSKLTAANAALELSLSERSSGGTGLRSFRMLVTVFPVTKSKSKLLHDCTGLGLGSNSSCSKSKEIELWPW